MLLSFVYCFGGIRCWLDLFSPLAIFALYDSLCFLGGQCGYFGFPYDVAVDRCLLLVVLIRSFGDVGLDVSGGL